MKNYSDYLVQLFDYISFDDADWPMIQVNDDDGYLSPAQPASDGLADLLRELRDTLTDDGIL